MVYCVYYYSGVLKKAPFRFDEFKSFTIQYGTVDSLVNSYNSETGVYQYLNDKNELVKMNLRLTNANLDTLHKRAYRLGFFDFPLEELGYYKPGGKGMKPVRYIITFNYKRKSKKVIFDSNFAGDPRLKDANEQMIKKIKTVLIDAEDENKK